MNRSISITLVNTRNSVYQYSRVHGELLGTLVCLTGTYAGKAFPRVSQETWAACHPVVGQPLVLTRKKTGEEVFRTSTVLEVKVLGEELTAQPVRPQGVRDLVAAIVAPLRDHAVLVDQPKAKFVAEANQARPVVLQHTHEVCGDYDIWTDRFGWVTRDRVKGCKACGHQGVDLWASLS